MKKNNKPTKEVKPVNQSKVLSPEQKEGRIKELREEYSKLNKKTNKEARQIRRKLRRLGVYLSKENISLEGAKELPTVVEVKVLPKSKKIVTKRVSKAKAKEVTETLATVKE